MECDFAEAAFSNGVAKLEIFFGDPHQPVAAIMQAASSHIYFIDYVYCDSCSQLFASARFIYSVQSGIKL